MSEHSDSSHPIVIISCVMWVKPLWSPHPVHCIKPDLSVQIGCALFQLFGKSDFLADGFSGKEIDVIYTTELASLFILDHFLWKAQGSSHF